MWWRNSYSGSLFVGDVLVPESGNVRSMTTVSQWVRIFLIISFLYLIYIQAPFLTLRFPLFFPIFFLSETMSAAHAHYDHRESMGASPTSRCIYVPPFFCGSLKKKKRGMEKAPIELLWRFFFDLSLFFLTIA